jgi:F420-non-reducing hydrogenase small subunit
MDFKYADVERMPDKHIDVCFFNGGIRNSEQEHLAKLLRQKSKVLIAYGACAHLGGVPGLANLASKKEIFEKAYSSTFSTTNAENITPKTLVHVKEGEVDIPEFYDTVKTLDQVVDVDYYVPGCPPAVERTLFAVGAIVKDELPPKGSVLAPLKSVCDECSRKKENKQISKLYRVYEKIPEPERCLLEQGILCMGPATRGGCGARCLKADMPCTGCGGPCPNSPEQGAAMISALASILGLEDEQAKYSEEEVEKLIGQVKDPVGTFYMYALPASILRRKVMKE